MEGGAAPRKVFVTGVYGSGKSRFARGYARRLGARYVDFDRLHAYGVRERQSDRILAGLPESFVIDAIPIDGNSRWDDFAAYEAQNDVLVVCVYCPDRAQWLRRVQEKAYRAEQPRGAGEKLRRTYRLLRLRMRRDAPIAVDRAHHLGKYRNFFRQNLPYLERFRFLRCFDSCREEYTTLEEMAARIGYRTFALEDRLESLGKDHDRNYQDIEVLGLVGYSESHRTWERICGLVDWKGKKVLDLGCFHGYFAFKAEDAGAVVEGLDRSPAVLAVARMINEVRGGRVAFREWIGGDDLPACDLVLCLNVLHHFADPEAALARMACREALFEIKEESRPAVERFFAVEREVPSHRDGRRILLCARREEAREAWTPGAAP